MITVNQARALSDAAGRTLKEGLELLDSLITNAAVMGKTEVDFIHAGWITTAKESESLCATESMNKLVDRLKGMGYTADLVFSQNRCFIRVAW